MATLPVLVKSRNRGMVVLHEPKDQSRQGGGFAVKPKVKVTLILRGNANLTDKGWWLSLASAGKSYRYLIAGKQLETVSQAAIHEGIVLGIEGTPAEVFSLIRNAPSCCAFVYGEAERKHLTVEAKEVSAVISQSKDMADFSLKMAAYLTVQERIKGAPALFLLSKAKYSATVAANAAIESRLICRSKEHFRWPKNHLGIMLLDHDLLKPERFKDGQMPNEPRSIIDFISYIGRASKLFADVCFTTMWSSSAFIYRTDTNEYVTQECGLHLLLVVDKPSSIDAVIKRLWDRLALDKKQGVFMEVTKSGAILKKTFLDLAPVQQNHLDFAGKATFPMQHHNKDAYAPLCKRIPPGTIIENPGGRALDTDAFLKDCTVDETKLKQRIRKLSRDPELQKFARERLASHCEEMIAKELLKHPDAGENEKKAIGKQITKEFVSLQYHRKIGPNSLIYINEFTSFTVAYILEHWDEFVGSGCCSPAEPSYNDYAHCAHIYTLAKTGEKVIMDFAHGKSRCYRLYEDEEECVTDMPAFIKPEDDDGEGESRLPKIYCVKGELSRQCDEAEEVLLDAEIYYDYTGQIAMLYYDLVRRTILPSIIAEKRFVRELAKCIRWLAYDKAAGGFVPCDPPEKVVGALTKAPFIHVPRLSGMTHQPFFKRSKDGTSYELVQTYGYCPDTFTFSTCQSEEFNIKPDANRDDALAALQMIQDDLLKGFKYKDRILGLSQSTSVCLTAATRSSIDLAPGVEVSSREAQSGKGTMSEVFAYFCSGDDPSGGDYTADEAEFTKRVVALYDGNYQVLYWANATDQNYVAHSFLSQSLTATTVVGRILGFSKVRTFPTNRLIIIEGNGIQTPLDLVRKLMRIRLDPKPKVVYETDSPAQIMKQNRAKYVSAALTIMQAYINHTKEHGRINCPEKVPSYSTDWQFLVREPLLWLGQEDPAKEMLLVRKGDIFDDEKAVTQKIVTAWYEHLPKDTAFTATAFVDKLLGIAAADPQSDAADVLNALRELHPVKIKADETTGGIAMLGFGHALKNDYTERWVCYAAQAPQSDISTACYIRLIQHGKGSPRRYTIEVDNQNPDLDNGVNSPQSPPDSPNNPSSDLGMEATQTSDDLQPVNTSSIVTEANNNGANNAANNIVIPELNKVIKERLIASFVRFEAGVQLPVSDAITRFNTNEITTLFCDPVSYSTEEFLLLSKLVQATSSYRKISQTQWESLYPDQEKVLLFWEHSGEGEADFDLLTQRRNRKIDAFILNIALGARAKKDYFSLLGECGVMTQPLAQILETVYELSQKVEFV